MLNEALRVARRDNSQTEHDDNDPKPIGLATHNNLLVVVIPDASNVYAHLRQGIHTCTQQLI